MCEEPFQAAPPPPDLCSIPTSSAPRQKRRKGEGSSQTKLHPAALGGWAPVQLVAARMAIEGAALIYTAVPGPTVGPQGNWVQSCRETATPALMCCCSQRGAEQRDSPSLAMNGGKGKSLPAGSGEEWIKLCLGASSRKGRPGPPQLLALSHAGSAACTAPSRVAALGGDEVGGGDGSPRLPKNAGCIRTSRAA